MKNKVINVYDKNDTTAFIDASNQKSLADLGFELPDEPPSKVISLRIPTKLYNKIRAYSTNIDMPYQAYIKYLLSKGIEKDMRKSKPL